MCHYNLIPGLYDVIVHTKRPLRGEYLWLFSEIYITFWQVTDFEKSADEINVVKSILPYFPSSKSFEADLQ